MYFFYNETEGKPILVLLCYDFMKYYLEMPKWKSPEIILSCHCQCHHRIFFQMADSFIILCMILCKCILEQDISTFTIFYETKKLQLDNSLSMGNDYRIYPDYILSVCERQYENVLETPFINSSAQDVCHFNWYTHHCVIVHYE